MYMFYLKKNELMQKFKNQNNIQNLDINHDHKYIDIIYSENHYQ